VGYTAFVLRTGIRCYHTGPPPALALHCRRACLLRRALTILPAGPPSGRNSTCRHSPLSLPVYLLPDAVDLHATAYRLLFRWEPDDNRWLPHTAHFPHTYTTTTRPPDHLTRRYHLCSFWTYLGGRLALRTLDLPYTHIYGTARRYTRTLLFTHHTYAPYTHTCHCARAHTRTPHAGACPYRHTAPHTPPYLPTLCVCAWPSPTSSEDTTLARAGHGCVVL